MAIRNINWDACFKNLRKIFPEIKSELEKINQRAIIEIEEFPPHISIFTGQEENSEIVKALEEISDKYKLRAHSGFYDGRQLIHSIDSFVLKPDYQKFVI